MNSATKGRLIGLAGLAGFAVWISLSLGSSFYLCLDSQRWPVVPVRITSSTLATGESNAGRWWQPDLVFEYSLGGHSYQSSSVRYMMPVFYHQDDARKLQQEYPAGLQTLAAYNPRNLSQSVLQPGVPSGMWWRALIPLFLWSLLGYIYYEIRRPQRRFLLLPDIEPATQD